MLGIFKKCLISLSVMFGGFGVNLGSSVIDVSNSTNNVFRTQLKKANDRASSGSFKSYNVGDIFVYKDISYYVDFILTESNFSLGFVSKPTSFIYFDSLVMLPSSSSSNYYYSCSLQHYSSSIRFSYDSYAESVNRTIYINSGISSISGLYRPPLFLSFNDSYTLTLSPNKPFTDKASSFNIFLLSLVPPVNPVTDSISIIVSGLTEFGKGLGQGISDIVTAMMYTGEGVSKTLSPFFVVVLVFASIALCVSLTSLMFNWLRDLGGK